MSGTGLNEMLQNIALAKCAKGIITKLNTLAEQLLQWSSSQCREHHMNSLRSENICLV